MGLHENLRSENVKSLTWREPVTASPDELLSDLLPVMRSRGIGCVIAIDQAGKPLGLFTESMLVRRLAQGQSDHNVPLANIMATDWPTVNEDDRIVTVLELMRSRNVRFIMIVNSEGVLVGLTGQKGMMEYVAEHFPGQVMVQRIGGTAHLQSREGA